MYWVHSLEMIQKTNMERKCTNKTTATAQLNLSGELLQVKALEQYYFKFHEIKTNLLPMEKVAEPAMLLQTPKITASEKISSVKHNDNFLSNLMGLHCCPKRQSLKLA